jgi:glycine oxidase
MPESADVVVVGAGVVGGSIAYVLARGGLKVCVMERGAVGSGASGHGHGVLSLVGNDFRQGPHFMLGLASARAYPDFAGEVKEASGVDPLYHELPSLSLALIEEEERIFKGVLGWQGEHLDLRWVGMDEARQLEPRITPEGIGAVLNRHGQVDGYRMSLATIAATERLGGRLLQREATGLRVQAGRVAAVNYPGGEVRTDTVVLATGAWVTACRDWLGFPIPVKPLHGEVLHVRLPGPPLRVFILTARHGPLLQRRDGLIMAGSIGGVTMSGMDVHARHVFDPADTGPWEFDLHPHDAGRDRMLDCALRIMPGIEEAELVAHLAGVRPLSADRMPLIGRVPGVEGAYLATGHGTKGIHLAPITAEIIGDLIMHSRMGPGLEAFLPRRFEFMASSAASDG